MRAHDAMGEVARKLRDAGVDGPAKEAELLLSVGLGIDRVALLRDDPELTAGQMQRLEAMAARRAAREPAHYILGSLEFFGLHIKVAPGVLIPRPETELLAEATVEALREIKTPRLLDLCTGSGAVALSVAARLPGASGLGTDISQKAIALARENAGLTSISQVEFLLGSLFEPARGMRFDAVVANPPYVRAADIETLAPEIRDYEPREALDGGPEGLDIIEKIIHGAPAFLKSGGWVLMEIGHGQAGAVQQIARATGALKLSRVVRDHAGHERIVIFRGPRALLLSGNTGDAS